MTDNEPEYRRRIRDKGAQDERQAERERQKAAKDADTNKVVAAIKSLGQKIDSQGDENTPQKKRDRCWQHAEVIGLWVAAFVGVAAVIVASRDSGKQYQAMIDSTASENRAWVSVTSPGIVLLGPENINARLAVNVENIGRQPALDISSFIEPFAYRPLGGGPRKILSFEKFETNKSCEKPALSNVGALWPAQQPLVRASADDTIKVDKVAMMAGEVWYGIRGCVHYTTMGKPRVTAFCYVNLPPVHAPLGKWDWTICTGKGQQYAN